MPTYKYHCASCDNMFELVQRMSEGNLYSCIVCGECGNLNRVPNNEGGFSLKGSGWTPKYGK